MSVLGRTRDAVMIAVLSLAFFCALATSAWALPDFDGDGSLPPADCNNLDASAAPGKPDTPDLAFEDTNCDGIDGTASQAVFVSRSTGDNAFSGTKDFPKRTIGAAVTVAKAANKDVFVTAGPYNEVVNVEDGVDIYGGYVPVTFQRSTTEATVITGARQAVLADGDESAILQLLTLSGVAPAAGGESAYGVRAINGARLALRRVTATGGDARAGVNGSSPAQRATPARPATATCNVGDAARGAPGTGGNTGGLGGGGGFGFAPPGTAGVAGSGPAAGAGGPLGATNGGPGGDATAPGANGGNGAPATFNLLNATSLWSGNNNATNGGTGSPGSGGGGGGGTNGMFAFVGNPPIPVQSAGAGGGGGGAGGFGGSQGTRGFSGGGSFGAYLSNATLVAAESTLTGGKGGNGGNGGEGAAGGAGGPGGFGAFCTFFGNVRLGGTGGTGSAGGAGGDGGGGPGGPSAGVFRTGGGSVYTSRGSTQTAGAAGLGGTRGTQAGAPRAAAGLSQPIMSAPSATGTSADFDEDGRTDATDTCPETAATAGDADGCPNRPAKLPDADGDQIPNANDACASVPRGTDLDENGCPDTPPPPPGIDQDGDGFFAGQDCIDTNPAIRPGAQEIIGNTVDENCDGVATPFPDITSAVGNDWSVLGRRVRATELVARRVPTGSRGQIRCIGKRCAFKRKTVRARRGSINFLKALKKKQRRWQAGQTIEVRITAPNFNGKVVRFKLKRNRIPKGQTLCLPNGRTRPVRSC